MSFNEVPNVGNGRVVIQIDHQEGSFVECRAGHVTTQRDAPCWWQWVMATNGYSYLLLTSIDDPTEFEPGTIHHLQVWKDWDEDRTTSRIWEVITNPTD